MSNPCLPFARRLLPAPVNGGFSMPGYWVWCGSTIRGEDGRYHMFAARWPAELPFFEGYKCYSEVVRAVADTPVGPFTLAEVVLPDRGPSFWDGRMTHNPTVQRVGDRYLLYYIGATFDGPKPTAPELRTNAPGAFRSAYGTIRIGLATARRITGPWERRAEPVLQVRPGQWDGTVTTNPAPCLKPEGGIFLYYRSNTPQGCRIGLAEAESPDGPCRRVRDDPILPDCHIEDPCVYWMRDHYELIAKDLTGKITGELHAGVHAWSPDGVEWKLADPPLAYSRTIEWEDGRKVEQGCLERPQLLFEDGEPTHLYAATGDGPGGFRNATRTWNMVIPLRKMG